MSTHGHPVRYRDQALIEGAVGVLSDDWLAGIDGVLDEPLAHIAFSANELWRTVFKRERVQFATVVRETIARAFPKGIADGDRMALQKAGEVWIDAYGADLVERFTIPQLRRAMAEAPDGAEVDAARVVLERVPAQMERVVQPALRRLLSVGGLARLARRVTKDDDAGTAEGLTLLGVPEGAGIQQPQQGLPKKPRRRRRRKALGEGIDENASYVIITAGDSDVCPVCETMEEAGEFSLKDALASFDNFLDIRDEGELIDELESVSFPSLADVEDLDPEELASLGYDVPPFHPNCRCGVALVD